MDKVKVRELLMEAAASWLKVADHPLVVYGDAAKVLEGDLAECILIDIEVNQEMFKEIHRQVGFSLHGPHSVYIQSPDTGMFRITCAPSGYISSCLEHSSLWDKEGCQFVEGEDELTHHIGLWPGREFFY